MLQEELQALVDQYGAWTDHNIQLDQTTNTICVDRASPKLRRVLQLVSDFAGKDIPKLKILDLGCLEGGYAIEFALHGAETVGVEGRRANLEKALFAKRHLGLSRASFVHDDIRNVSEESYGRFDVILCLGVLYHLDAPAVFDLLKRLHQMCTRLVVFDTHVSVISRDRYDFEGGTYLGRDVIEYDPSFSEEEIEQELWGSIGNRVSFWPSKSSLLNLLTRVGFTATLECHVPIEIGKPHDRVTLVAMRGTEIAIRSCSCSVPPVNFIPERESRPLSPEQHTFQDLRRQFVLFFPRRLRNSLKAFARRLGILSRAPRLWEKPWRERHVPEESTLPYPRTSKSTLER